MICLGIDPGSRRIGYGLIEKSGNDLRMLDAGILPITSTDDIGALQEIKNGIGAIIEKHKPDIASIEKLYFAKNQKTGIAVAQARGVILLSLKECGIPIKEYSPSEMKLAVTGYGSADKKSVLKMVRLTLGDNNLTMIDDASDALALAVAASRERW